MTCLSNTSMELFINRNLFCFIVLYRKSCWIARLTRWNDFSHYEQVTLVDTTRLTLDWMRSNHHLSPLLKFYFENYRWVNTRIEKRIWCWHRRPFFKWTDFSNFLLRLSKVEHHGQLAVVRRRPYGPPLPIVRSCVS